MRMACGQPSAACAVHGDHGGGAAKRRRDRRLRMHWRHEQLSLQMALAAALHHSGDVGTYNALRSQKTARPRTTLCGARRPVWLGTPSSSRCTRKISGGTRPDRLAGVRPQVRLLRRTVEQIVNPVPVVPLLHDVEPQMVEQLVDMLSPLDFRVAEQVIQVPKIVCPRRAARTVLDVPQMAEQLVEVPTIMSFISLQQQTAEQIVDIPVPHRRRRGFKVYAQNRVQQHLFLRNAFLSGLWSTTSTFQFLVVKGVLLVFKVFFMDRGQQHCMFAWLS